MVRGAGCREPNPRIPRREKNVLDMPSYRSGDYTSLTAPSVVRGADGGLFDITPLDNERCRASMRFIPPLGDEQLFFSMKKLDIFIDCPQTSKDWEARMSIKATAVIKKETKVARR